MKIVNTIGEANLTGWSSMNSVPCGASVNASFRRDLYRNEGFIADAIQSSMLASRQLRKRIAAQTKAFMRLQEKLGNASISSRSVRIHFGIAIALISVLPMLTFAYIAFNDPAESVRLTMFAFMVCTTLLGYLLLVRYPMALSQLRDYLRQVASGEIPDAVNIMAGEPDLAAIQRYFSLVLDDMRNKVKLIERQKKELIEIERRNAMMVSLATACHYVGQPSTVISAYLDLMERHPMPQNLRTMLSECKQAIGRIIHTLRRFNLMDSYTTEPYLSSSQNEAAKCAPTSSILKLETN